MIRKINSTLRYLKQHPFASKHQKDALQKYIRWQVASRLQYSPSIVPWVNDAYLIAKSGMTGATGNIYAGLHEFNDMGFLLHFLRPDDSFVDAGSNIGSYTILAGKAIGATCYSFEPVPETYVWLSRNIGVNLISNRAFPFNMGLAASKSKLLFSKGLDTVNHVIQSPLLDKEKYVQVDVDALDNVVEHSPTLMKIDVEGFEQEVLAGSQRHLNSDTLKAIIIELNGSGERYGYKDENIHTSLIELGFQPFDYSPFQRLLIPLETFGTHNTIYLRDIDFAKTRVAEAPKFKLWHEAI